MISRLEGALFDKRPTAVGIDVAGVGYQVHIPLSTFTALPDEGKIVALQIHTQVRDDAIQLYGFASRREFQAFSLLLRANRVGPKLAQTVLSGIEAEALFRALAGGDATSLSKVPGIGAKTASRLVVELKDRAAELLGEAVSEPGAASGEMEGSARDQLLSALANLQVPKGQAERLVEEVVTDCGPDASIETLVRTALPRLAR